MTEWTHCPFCGGELDPGSTSCKHCGTAVEAAAPEEASTVAPAEADNDLEERLREALSPNYLLVRALGAGGMGTVFIARQPSLKRLVAVKVLSTELARDPEARARFEREAQAVAALSHPNVVSIYTVGELDDGHPYFVMQYVTGRSMSARVEEDGPLGVAEARRAMGEVASALAAAHAQGVIHRDIKPANILYDDSSGRSLVTDFGIAAVRKKEDAEQQTRLTKTGMSIGTPRYMSPEQLLAEDVTEKTDMYALGLLGYELLAGKGPFEASTPEGLIAAHLRDTPAPLTSVRDDMDPEVDSVVTACLSKDAAERPTASEVAQRLLPEAAGVLLEWPPPGLEGLQARLVRPTRLLGIGSLFVVTAFLLQSLWALNVSRVTATFAAMGAGVLVMIGTLLVIAGGVALAKAGRFVKRGLAAGYGVATLAEVLVDRRRDGGALITGMREYATLPAQQRNTLRRYRLLGWLAMFVAAALPLPALLAFIWLGVRGVVNPSMAPWVIGTPPLALLLWAMWLRNAEQLIVGPLRRSLARRGSPDDDLTELASGWNASFDTVRKGQPIGRGRVARPVGGWLVALGTAAATILAGLLLLPFALVGASGPVTFTLVVPRFFATMQERERAAEAFRPYRLQADTSITALQAGRDYYTLVLAGLPPEPSGFEQHPPPRELPGRWFGTDPSAPFATAQSRDSLIWRATAGFTAAEAAHLDAVASHPGFEEFDRFARAPSYDYLAARFVLPFADSLISEFMPLAKFWDLRTISSANVARAALLLSRGREGAAETALRASISFGFHLMDEGITLNDAFNGADIVRTGGVALEQLYAVTGRDAEVRAIRARQDSIAGVQEDASVLATRGFVATATGARLRREMLRLVLDSSQVKGVRVTLMPQLLMSPCMNLKELIFGPSQDVVDAYEALRSELAVFPSEEAYFDLLRTDFERLPMFFSGGQLIEGAAFLARVLFGTNRIASCVLLQVQ